MISRSKWFIKWSIFCKQKYMVQNFNVRSDLCDYSDEYIVVKGRISVTDHNSAYRINKKLTFNDNALFRSCI